MVLVGRQLPLGRKALATGQGFGVGVRAGVSSAIETVSLTIMQACGPNLRFQNSGY
jgi:hypothetical protein